MNDILLQTRLISLIREGNYSINKEGEIKKAVIEFIIYN